MSKHLMVRGKRHPSTFLALALLTKVFGGPARAFAWNWMALGKVLAAESSRLAEEEQTRRPQWHGQQAEGMQVKG
jgi:hypothetical protein